MKGQFIAFMIGLLCVSWACSEENNHLPIIEPEDHGVFTDSEGREFPWVRYGNLEWMTTNLNIELPKEDEWTNTGCEISREEDRNPIDQELEIKQNYETFGCLYTYEAATSAIPEGWRIPTDEDWQSLEKSMGMSNRELNLTGWRGTNVGTLLQQEEGTMINLRTGGMGEYDGYGYFTPYFIYVYGFYWTATPEKEGSNLNYCRQISYKSDKIARTTVDRSKMLYVRYVRDVNNETNK